ncbi:MAG TPA: CaiB/BaiF CoA-transferase family protein [Pseudonocardiaceae bacterium]|nr:CaiB/BaiF CoA-transferase family protein [Pseudonocardiaceae bacterium]
MTGRGGALHGLRVVEFAALGPAPHAAMMLADHGADVVRVVRPGGQPLSERGVRLDALMTRNKRSLALDLKSDEDRTAALRLVEAGDVLLEGLRPGAAESLGIGPEVCCDRNPRLVYARMTGWGQHGPLARRAGHDINYIGLTGALAAIGPAGRRPVPPLNLVGDFGGGSMLVLVGILLALWERERSGRGQVVDAAMVDGAALLSQMLLEMTSLGAWPDPRGENLLDGGAPFYDTYECADGRHVAVGALEPRFFDALVSGLGLDASQLPAQYDRSGWANLRTAFADAFLTRDRDTWAARFDRLDACVSPVLSVEEAADHPHSRARGMFTTLGSVRQAATAPRLSRTPGAPPKAERRIDTTEQLLAEWTER